MNGILTSALAQVLALLIGLIIGYWWGDDAATRTLMFRDHVQATAGVFIDGQDHNKIYRIVPAQ